VQLEVITGNQPAIKTYQDIGFQITRELDCYKGAVYTGEIANDYQIQALENYDWELMQSYWDWSPSWQNSMTAMKNLAHSNASFGIYADQHLLGYLIYNPLSKRVQQFAVHKSHRGKGVGRHLFHHIAQKFGKDISIINVEHGAAETGRFLKSIGLEIYVKQYEMEYRMK
jgi:ribosomal protein S18 acetylase RimI-like enzyme